MSGKHIFTVIAIIAAIMLILIIGFLYYVLTFKPQAEIDYHNNKEIAITKVVESENTKCKNGVVYEDISNPIPDYKYNDVMGSIKFYSLDDLEIPILYGNPKNDFKVAMESGGAFDPTSSLPYGETTTVISGHKNIDFAEMQYLEVGDKIALNINGNVYLYEVAEIDIVDDSNESAVYYDQNDLVIYTCYPFEYQKFYSQRYIVVAHHIQSIECSSN